MLPTAILFLALGQLPQDALTDPIDVTETCWSFAAPAGFSGFGGFGSSYRAQSFSFNEESFGATPAFGSGFSFGGGLAVPYQVGFGVGFGPQFGYGGWPGSWSPRIKIKNKIKFRGRRW